MQIRVYNIENNISQMWKFSTKETDDLITQNSGF